MTQMRMKQGATFSAIVGTRDNVGNPLNLGAAVLSCALATPLRVAVAGLTVTALPDAPGQALLLADATVTATWPIGALRGEVTVTSGGVVIFTETFLLFVEAPVAATVS